MSDFAKIVIASDGEQVLFYLDNGDNGPELVQMTEIEGITARVGLGFKDDDSGDAARERAFNEVGIKQADAMRKLAKRAVQ